MVGIIVTDGNVYIGEHKCPMDERERKYKPNVVNALVP